MNYKPEIITDEKLLRRKSVPVEKGDFIVDIVNTLKTALDTSWTPGCGLAAAQCGILKRIAYFNAAGRELVLVNPRIIPSESKNAIIQKEGCLSIRDKWYRVPRFTNIVYTADAFIEDMETLVDWKWETKTYPAEGFFARALAHEIDHFDGILCKDREFKAAKKLGRNDPCFCGSGKKYKKCCL